MSVHAADPRVVYALVESQEEGEPWRSDDHGPRPVSQPGRSFCSAS